MKKEAMLYEKLDDKHVRCFLCAHRCRIADSLFGACGVRQNQGGVLYTLVYGEVISSHIDPIEKKPLYHFLPGSKSYSVATMGCNFKCGFCQNWEISQISKKQGGDVDIRYFSPEEIVTAAIKGGCASISYTYTEPTIFFEFAFDTAKIAKGKGLRNNFVTNGFMTREALETVKPYLDAANVDLKGFTEEFYAKICKGSLRPVLDSIRTMKELGIWVEITTLVIPGQNDSEDELKGIADFISGIDKDMPWHISRFHPDYKFADYPTTPIETIKKAKEIGKKAGLKYIYLGNIYEGNDTHCPNCDNLLVSRMFFDITANNIKGGKCPSCKIAISGVWA